MNISYADAVQNMHTYLEQGREYDKDLSIELTKDLNIPSSLECINMLDNLDNTVLKVQFVDKMLKGGGLVLKHKDNTILTAQFTDNESLPELPECKLHPGLLRFIVDAVFSVFLKNSYPLSSESL